VTDTAHTHPAAEAESEDAAAIRRIHEQLLDLWHAEDSAGLAGLYADDALLMDPNTPSIRGAAAIGAHYQIEFDFEAKSPFDLEITADVRELEVLGDTAYTRHVFTVTATPKAGGTPIQYSGKAVTVFGRQDDGTWKIRRDISNTDAPLPGA